MTSEASTSLQSYLSSLPEYASTPRIQSLYSDLGRQKVSNPGGYAANLSWWRSILVAIVEKRLQSKNQDALLLHVDQELSDALRLEKAGRPAGLGTVIDDLAHDGAIQPLAQFLSSSVSIYESGSVVGRVADLLIKKSLWWALESLNLVSPSEDEGAAARWKRVCGDYVVVSVLEKLANSIIAAQDEKSALTLSESLYNTDSFKKYAESCVSISTTIKTLSDTDVKVLLKYLSRDRRVVIIQGEVIKFAEEPAAREITSIDQGVLELKTTIERVEQQVDHIQASINLRTGQIKAALQASRKEIAKLQLTSRRALESLLNQRVGTLTTLTAALSSIDQAHGDAAIVRAYQTSVKVLKDVMSKPEMQRERVDEVMDKLREGMEGAEEIRKAVEEGGWEVVEASGVDVDEDELQKELDAIIAEEKSKQETVPQPQVQRVLSNDEKRILELTRKLEGESLNEKSGSGISNERVAEVA